jgi:hypothetical protein
MMILQPNKRFKVELIIDAPNRSIVDGIIEAIGGYMYTIETEEEYFARKEKEKVKQNDKTQ